jgi:hypothetical protein
VETTQVTSKEQREQIMSDEDRLAEWRKKGRRCFYCLGERPVNTITDRLFGCCDRCAERDAKQKIVRQSLPCVVCKENVDSIHDPEGVTIVNVNHSNFGDGIAGRIEAGYGSTLDGNMYMIAICDNCVRKADADGRITFVDNYIPGVTKAR